MSNPHDITEILLKVALNTIKLPINLICLFCNQSYSSNGFLYMPYADSNIIMGVWLDDIWRSCFPFD